MQRPFRIAIAALTGAALLTSFDGSSDGTSDASAAWVPPLQQNSAVVWAVGDGADGRKPARRVARMIASRELDRFLYLGDVLPVGNGRDYRRHYRPVYGRFNAVAAPTIGNHEWKQRRSGYIPYWTQARGSRARMWHSFEVAGWQFLSLNSMAKRGPRSRQVRWLRRELRRTPEYGSCRVAFIHHPRFSAGRGDPRGLTPLTKALRGRAPILLSGHDHSMQRFRSIKGITQFVAGSGGARGRASIPRDRRLRFSARRYGALRLDLKPNQVVARFVSDRGGVLDRRKISCGRP